MRYYTICVYIDSGWLWSEPGLDRREKKETINPFHCSLSSFLHGIISFSYPSHLMGVTYSYSRWHEEIMTLSHLTESSKSQQSSIILLLFLSSAGFVYYLSLYYYPSPSSHYMPPAPTQWHARPSEFYQLILTIYHLPQLTNTPSFQLCSFISHSPSFQICPSSPSSYITTNSTQSVQITNIWIRVCISRSSKNLAFLLRIKYKLWDDH